MKSACTVVKDNKVVNFQSLDHYPSHWWEQNFYAILWQKKKKKRKEKRKKAAVGDAFTVFHGKVLKVYFMTFDRQKEKKKEKNPNTTTKLAF